MKEYIGSICINSLILLGQLRTLLGYYKSHTVSVTWLATSVMSLKPDGLGKFRTLWGHFKSHPVMGEHLALSSHHQFEKPQPATNQQIVEKTAEILKN